MYEQYISRFYKDDKSKCIPAQLLYDWRAVTGFISGTDLHEVFRSLCVDMITEESHQYDIERWGIGTELGRPSPSGYRQISLDAIREHQPFLFDEAFSEADNAQDFLSLALDYDADLDFGIDAIRTVEDVEELRLRISAAFGVS